MKYVNMAGNFFHILLTGVKNISYNLANFYKKPARAGSQERIKAMTTANQNQPEVLRLADYRRPDFTTDEVYLNFDIHKDHTIVTSKVTYKRSAEGKDAPALVLHAEDPNKPALGPYNPVQPYLQRVKLNGVELAPGTGYIYDEEKCTLSILLDPGEKEAEVQIETFLEPEKNLPLTGLYKSDSTFMTQNESEGFRRITPFLDRPDVMARYTVRIEADKKDIPVLLANGNRTAGGDLLNGRHWAEFQDPFLKPCYLFCTANGNLGHIHDTYLIGDDKNRPVDIAVYAESGLEKRGYHALEALKMAMRWDEEVFGCEYDLNNFKIVAAAKFNFGAMENKGLNVFRDSAILADPEIATDANYQTIIDIVGHEYFHNWSGNRVTLANWFYISLKEGLTVLRERMFTAAVTSTETERIGSVQDLRSRQFLEDDKPTAHPVLPQEASSIENLYDGTVYEKGAEVLRMMGVLVGEETLIKGIKHYFKKHDGQAVTIHEFVKAIEEVSGENLHDQFFLWYTQSGRPRVKAEGKYDPVSQTYTLTMEQHVPPTLDQPTKKNMLIPVKMGLVDSQGNDMPLVLETDTPDTPGTGTTDRVLRLTEGKQVFVFKNVKEEPAFHSLFRGFSAPVTVTDSGLSEDQLHKQLLIDTDGFNRWDAGQQLALAERKRVYESYLATGTLPEVNSRYLETLRTLVKDAKHAPNPMLIEMALTPPSIEELESIVQPVSPSAIVAVSKHMRKSIATALRQEFEELYAWAHDGKPYVFNFKEAGKRSLKSLAATYLTESENPADMNLLRDQYMNADNATDRVSAMAALRNHPSAEREEIFKNYYERFKADQMVIQKWFSMQALSSSDSTIGYLRDLIKTDPGRTKNDVFNWENPGHVGSLVGGLARNYEQFHRQDGAGYEFVADGVIRMDRISPNISSRLADFLCDWRKYADENQRLIVNQLDRINAAPNISTDVRERLVKSLPTDQERQRLGLPVGAGGGINPAAAAAPAP